MDRGAWWATVHEKHETQTSNGNQEVEGKEVRKVVRELSSWSFKVTYMLKIRLWSPTTNISSVS